MRYAPGIDLAALQKAKAGFTGRLQIELSHLTRVTANFPPGWQGLVNETGTELGADYLRAEMRVDRMLQSHQSLLCPFNSTSHCIVKEA